MKKFQNRSVQIITCLIIAISYILSNYFFKEHGYWYYFFLNIATDLFVLVFATFVVEKAIEDYKIRQEEKRWSTARNYALADIGNLSRSLATTILLYTKTDFDVQTASQQTKIGNSHLLEKLEQVEEKHFKTFFEMLFENSKEVKKAFMRDKIDLESTISLYKDVLPPDFLETLWEVRSSTNRFNIAFTESYNILTVQKIGENNEETNETLREWAINTCKTSLKTYIKSIIKLLKTVNEE